MNEGELFIAAIQIENPADRTAYLSQACGSDVALRERVEALLKASAQAGSFLQQPASPVGVTNAETIRESPGTIIGPYKLLQEIGEGGMGTVFMAEQSQPIQRKVALKVIKPGMDSRQVIARFEAERQALAMMDHVNIARVVDGGATESGRPYFVMELVHGVPITKYCDDNHLTPRERLELFLPVCHAIQHAHQKGIIHRDIKPSNVMVTLYDPGTPGVPKVIDFGVAKATEQKLTERTLFTQYGTMVGTLEYMSPEQAEMNAFGVDTRSDIYSLGVLLYELLTGSTPLTRQRMKDAAYAEILRMIKEEEPPKPSTRLSDSGEALASISANRHTEPAKLTKLVRGELDWIVMKCLEKDRNRRYETANGFAMDIQRYLADEPVLACPPSAGYRLRKFVRRNKGPVLAASVFVLTLIGGIIGTSVGMLRAMEAENATRAESIEKDKATSEAEKQAAIATSIARYLQQMLGSIAPSSKGHDYTVRQLLDDYAAELEKQLPNHPEVEATLQATLGETYGILGERDKARKHLSRALELRRNVFGDKHEKYAEALVDDARPDANPPATRAAREADLRQALAIYRARGVGGQPVIRALWTLGWNLVEQAHAGAPVKLNELEPVVKEALAEARKSPGTQFPEMAGIYRHWAHSKMAQGQYAEAETIVREAIAIDLKLRPNHPERGWGYFVLAGALRKQNKFSEALQADKEVLAIMRRVAPPGHRFLALALTAVIDTLALADDARVLADLFPSAMALEELESVFRQVLSTSKPSSLNYDDPALVAARGLIRFGEFYLHLSHEFAAAGKAKEAEEARQKANLVLESLPTQLAGNADLLPYFYGYGAVAWMKAGQPERAKELCRKLLDQASPKAAGLHNHVAWFLATAEVPAHRDPALAIELAKKAVESNPQSSFYRNTLGVARYRAGDWKQAIADLKESISLGKGGNSFDWFFLAMAHWQLDEKDEARKWYDKAAEWMDKHQPKNAELRRFQAEAAELLSVNEKNE